MPAKRASVSAKASAKRQTQRRAAAVQKARDTKQIDEFKRGTGRQQYVNMRTMENVTTPKDTKTWYTKRTDLPSGGSWKLGVLDAGKSEVRPYLGDQSTHLVQKIKTRGPPMRRQRGPFQPGVGEGPYGDRNVVDRRNQSRAKQSGKSAAKKPVKRLPVPKIPPKQATRPKQVVTRLGARLRDPKKPVRRLPAPKIPQKGGDGYYY